jgi:hypothetical protein
VATRTAEGEKMRKRRMRTMRTMERRWEMKRKGACDERMASATRDAAGNPQG